MTIDVHGKVPYSFRPVVSDDPRPKFTGTRSTPERETGSKCTHTHPLLLLWWRIPTSLLLRPCPYYNLFSDVGSVLLCTGSRPQEKHLEHKKVKFYSCSRSLFPYSVFDTYLPFLFLKTGWRSVFVGKVGLPLVEKTPRLNTESPVECGTQDTHTHVHVRVCRGDISSTWVQDSD